MTIYLGTQGWSYKDWVGPFYPAGATSREYLRLYSRQFNAVELDSTFYGTPAPSRVHAWRESTPPGFRFTAKVPRQITHDFRLLDVEAEFETFVDVIGGLDEKLGAILIQLPPDMTIDERPAVEAFLGRLPPGFDFAVEFRHRSWLREDIFDFLRDRAVAWTTAVALPYMPEHVELTAPFAYVRWMGDHRRITRLDETQIDNQADLDRWATRLDEIAQHVQRIYGFANNHYSGHSPNDIRHLQSRLGIQPLPPNVPEQGVLL
jgi:uncharacterized protein YecE (DUF72 family)